MEAVSGAKALIVLAARARLCVKMSLTSALGAGSVPCPVM